MVKGIPKILEHVEDYFLLCSNIVIKSLKSLLKPNDLELPTPNFEISISSKDLSSHMLKSNQDAMKSMRNKSLVEVFEPLLTKQVKYSTKILCSATKSPRPVNQFTYKFVLFLPDTPIIFIITSNC